MALLQSRNQVPTSLRRDTLNKNFHMPLDTCWESIVNMPSLRYLQNETDLPTTPPDNNMVLTPNMITKKLTPRTKIINKPIKHQRSNSLSEINDTIFNIAIKESHKVKLPSLEQCRPLQKRKIFKTTTSLDNLPEEREIPADEPRVPETRNAFSSPQERTDFSQSDCMFGRPSLKQKNLSQCLLLGPQNLENIFDNKQIIENSQTLFLNTGYFSSQLYNAKLTNKISTSILANENKIRTVEDVLRDLNEENGIDYNENRIIHLVGEIYDKSQSECILINIAKVILINYSWMPWGGQAHSMMQKPVKQKSVFPEQTNHALYQLTSALRNLVSEELIYDSFINCGTINQLFQTLEVFASDIDIVANISRTMSIISTNECCCDNIMEFNNIYKIFILLFNKYPGNEEIIIRLTYTLGNIVAKIDDTRKKFFYEDGSIECLLHLWKIYLERTLQNCSLKLEQNDDFDSNPEDVMIKIIRVIANLVINPDIGKALNEKHGNRLISEVLIVLISNPFKKNEELVLSILSTLNNLSYYFTSELELDIFNVKQIDIVEATTEFTKSKNKECVIETMRILGNLSRSKITRNYILESEIFETLIKLLNKADLTLLKTTIGVFVNLMSDNRSRMLFKNSKGIPKVITILKDFCENDWLLGNLYVNCSGIIALTPLIYMNCYLKIRHEEKLFGIQEQNQDNNDIYGSQEYLIWEEFASVATNLLEKIEYFLDTFDQINIENSNTEMKETITIDNSSNLSFAAW
ncbi:hypothetical protein NQ317_000249 [Molorchus minor]|uniref:Armadillo repeat-containing protein 2 n=1 Tax=Molorchus minor TaxID=1323400 RepID=A0ABQ9JBJ8_9CUCU|nr:hypothetical protein NQ317_000249 [Molorchus minor]